MDKVGKLIVIDGADGSGKATQTQMLLERVQKSGRMVHKLDFPRYNENMMGALIGECIAGKHGDFAHIDPKIGSVLFAMDRFESKKLMEHWLDMGSIVILDRYVSANQIHQGGKIQDVHERENFLVWLDRLEHGVLGLPRPDLTLYLKVPTEVSLKLLQEKRAQDKKVEYLKDGAEDTLEADMAYMRNSLHCAEYLMTSGRGWSMVDCAFAGSMRSREDIHEEIYTVVHSSLGI